MDFNFEHIRLTLLSLQIERMSVQRNMQKANSKGHCLNKLKRPVHSEITSKTKVQMTSAELGCQVPSIVHGWLDRSLHNIVTGFDRTGHFLIRLFLIIFDQFIYKITWHFFVFTPRVL